MQPSKPPCAVRPCLSGPGGAVNLENGGLAARPCRTSFPQHLARRSHGGRREGDGANWPPTAGHFIVCVYDCSCPRAPAGFLAIAEACYEVGGRCLSVYGRQDRRGGRREGGGGRGGTRRLASSWCQISREWHCFGEVVPSQHDARLLPRVTACPKKLSPVELAVTPWRCLPSLPVRGHCRLCAGARVVRTPLRGAPVLPGRARRVQ